jgi:hypothetical protein
MEPVIPDEEFTASLAAFLDDPLAGLDSDTLDRRVGIAASAMARAIAEAESHTCPVEERTQSVVVRVVGIDGVDTLQEIPPGVAFACTLGALIQDDDVAGIQPLGYSGDGEPAHTAPAAPLVATPAEEEDSTTWEEAVAQVEERQRFGGATPAEVVESVHPRHLKPRRRLLDRLFRRS